MLYLLDHASAYNCDFLFASSSDIHGEPLPSFQDEHYLGNENSIASRSCLHQAKCLAESLCFDYLRMFHLRIHIARIFDAYGPRMNPIKYHVVPEYIY